MVRTFSRGAHGCEAKTKACVLVMRGSLTAVQVPLRTCMALEAARLHRLSAARTLDWPSRVFSLSLKHMHGVGWWPLLASVPLNAHLATGVGLSFLFMTCVEIPRAPFPHSHTSSSARAMNVTPLATSEPQLRLSSAPHCASLPGPNRSCSAWADTEINIRSV